MASNPFLVLVPNTPYERARRIAWAAVARKAPVWGRAFPAPVAESVTMDDEEFLFAEEPEPVVVDLTGLSAQERGLVSRVPEDARAGYADMLRRDRKRREALEKTPG